MDIFKRLKPYLSPYKRQFIWGPTFKFIEAILELIMPLVMASAIDNAVTGNNDNLWRDAIIMVTIVIVGFGCATICQYSAAIAQQGVGTRLRNSLFDHINSFSNKEVADFGTSSLINRVNNDVYQIQMAVASSIRIVVRAPFLCIGGIAMSAIISPKLAIIIVALMPFLTAIIVYVMKNSMQIYNSVQKWLDKIMVVLSENLAGVRVIRAFARTKSEQKRFEKTSEELANVSISAGKIAALLNPATQLILNAGIVLILWFGGGLVRGGDMTTGKIIALINYVGQILVALVLVANIVITASKAFASAKRIDEVLCTENTINDGTEGDEVLATAAKSENAVEFKNVSFVYHLGDYSVENISFCIKKHSTVGIIGGTGSGKSTIVNLIARLYDTTEGSVLINGVDIWKYKLSTLREMISIVSQKVELFSGTVEENIRFGNKLASIDDVKYAASIAQAAEFIESLPLGYDAPVDQGGANFSGGQKQRISIARAILKNSDIFIMDDASSALDYQTDAKLRRAIRQHSKKLTLFLVSQRISAVKTADVILVLDDGGLAGVGSHEELLQSCEAYREIYDSQNGEVDVL